MVSTSPVRRRPSAEVAPPDLPADHDSGEDYRKRALYLTSTAPLLYHTHVASAPADS